MSYVIVTLMTLGERPSNRSRIVVVTTALVLKFKHQTCSPVENSRTRKRCNKFRSGQFRSGRNRPVDFIHRCCRQLSALLSILCDIIQCRCVSFGCLSAHRYYTWFQIFFNAIHPSFGGSFFEYNVRTQNVSLFVILSLSSTNLYWMALFTSMSH